MSSPAISRRHPTRTHCHAEDIEQPAIFFGQSPVGSDVDSAVLFHVVIGQVANEAYSRSAAVQSAPERAVERAEARRSRQREQTERQVERLRERVRAARASSSAAGATDGVRGVDHLVNALHEKEGELEAIPPTLSKREASQVRAAAAAQLHAAEQLAATVASVQVRRNNVVFWKR